PDLLLPPYVFGGDLQYEMVDQFQVNEFSVSAPGTQGAKTVSPSGVAPTDTVTSGVLQASYVNLASQAAYGTYSSNPVGSPLTLPPITWNRASTQLAIPSTGYQGDPNLTDRAAWQANSRAEPWHLPAQVIIDLLSISNDPLVTKTILQTDPTSGVQSQVQV